MEVGSKKQPTKSYCPDQFPFPIGSMVLVYMLTLGYIDGIHVTIYSSTMDPMAYGFSLQNHVSQHEFHMVIPRF